MRKDEGVSLTELLISLFLSSLLMSLLMHHYLNSKQQYRFFQTTLEQRFDEQLITELIQGSIRRAGFTPCRGINKLISRDSRNEARNLVAVDANAGKYHALKLNRMSEKYFIVSNVLSPARLLLVGEALIESKKPVLIADCFHAEVHVIKSIQRTYQGTVITLKKPLVFDYYSSVYIGEWVEEQYFIKQNQQGLAALFYETEHQEELSKRFNQLSTRLIRGRGSILLQVTLQLLKGRALTIETNIRTP
ncbi:MAG: prepilin cleavage protein [Legionella sp.]|nr:prepilin cleavage protein [Legionella sp.]